MGVSSSCRIKLGSLKENENGLSHDAERLFDLLPSSLFSLTANKTGP